MAMSDTARSEAGSEPAVNGKNDDYLLGLNIFLLSEWFMHDSIHLSVALLPLEYWCANLSSSFEDLSFTVCSTALSESPKCLLCSPSTLHNHPPAGLVSWARIIVSQCGDYEFQVLLRTKDKGTVMCEDELHHLCGMLSKSSGYKFCPGLNKAMNNRVDT